MAKKKKENAPKPEQAVEKKEKQVKEKKPKEGGGPLLTVLSILLLVVGIGELALVVFMGFGAYRGQLAQRAYREQLAANSEQSGTPAVQTGYAGPWLTVENGRVTWRRADDPLALPLGGSSTAAIGAPAGGNSGGSGQTQTEYPRTPSSPPRSWVWTIDEGVG